jgi:putative NADPH-quinone reductase
MALKISLILAHPNPASFNHAIAQATLQTLQHLGHQVHHHDLYAEGFEPRLPAEEIDRDPQLPEFLQNHCRELSQADGIVIVHPNWWGQPPAILKGWIDRVLRPGVAYQFLEGDGGEGVPRGLLRARAALVFNTSNTPRHRELAVFGDPLETIWKNCIFGLCGPSEFFRRNFEVVVTSTPAQRDVWLREVQEIVARYFPG